MQSLYSATTGPDRDETEVPEELSLEDEPMPTAEAAPPEPEVVDVPDDVPLEPVARFVRRPI